MHINAFFRVNVQIKALYRFTKKMKHLSANALTAELGERLKQARLNQDLTQADVSQRAGISRRTVINAEKGQVALDNFIAILIALRLTEQLDQFLPPQPLSPVQLAKLQGKSRQRASGQHKSGSHSNDEDTPTW